jgi:hypothetical protein
LAFVIGSSVSTRACPMLHSQDGGAGLPIAADEKRLSRRAVLALPLLLVPLALKPRRGEDREIVVVDGWVLRRSDLPQL